MPNISMPSGQDWDAVNAGRGTGYTSAPKTAREITRMKAQGKLATERRYGDSAWRGGPPAPRPNPPPSGGRAFVRLRVTLEGDIPETPAYQRSPRFTEFAANDNNRTNILEKVVYQRGQHN